MNESRDEKQPPTVLIVDDDADLLQSLGSVVTDMGCRVLSASNGREALTTLHREKPSLMLIDLEMPVMNGRLLLRALREDPALSTIPRVVMTGLNDLMIAIKEDIEVLYKPVDDATLMRLVQKYLSRRPLSSSASGGLRCPQLARVAQPEYSGALHGVEQPAGRIWRA